MLHLFNRFRRPIDVIRAAKTVRVCGVNFTIKRIDPMDHAKGLKIMLSLYDTYKPGKEKDQEILSEGQIRKIRDHYRDVFMAAVIKPKLVRDENTENICVDEIFTDQEMTEKLYMEIMYHTYGKKKLKFQPVAAERL